MYDDMMEWSVRKKHTEPAAPTSENQHFPVVGYLTDSGNSGEIRVMCNGQGPKTARILSGMDRRALLAPENTGRQVLIVFENGNPDLPIIIGVMENLVADLVSLELEKTDVDAPAGMESVQVDEERLVIEAQKEVVLKCGQGSITLKRDGKIVLRGTEILSRASGTHRIKGGSVRIN